MLDDLELLGRERTGLVEDLVRAPAPCRGRGDRRRCEWWCAAFVQPQLPRPPPRRTGHPLAVPEGVAVGGFDRLAPVPNHREVGLLEPVHLGGRRPPGPPARRGGRTGGARRSAAGAPPDSAPWPGTAGPARARPPPRSASSRCATASSIAVRSRDSARAWRPVSRYDHAEDLVGVRLVQSGRRAGRRSPAPSPRSGAPARNAGARGGPRHG